MDSALLSLWQIGDNQQPNPNTLNISFYRNALQQGQAYLKQQFEDQADVITLVQQRAVFIDEVLQDLWRHHIAADIPISLVAVGGYGRGELHPYSDIDLLILLDESISKQPPAELSVFLTELWDVGLEIGHSVRTIQECRQQAEDDITIATTLLETRLLCGNNSLYLALQQLTISHKTWDTQRFYQAKKHEQLQRHLKYNDSANNLEPNIKGSPGGLRDLQVISWVAQQHFGVTDLKGLNQKGFIENSEYYRLDKAQRFLWRVRFSLHLVANRKQEKLLIDHQREVAKQLGYQETDNRLAVEIFMKDYYRCARSVSQMNELLLQLFEENIILANKTPHIELINQRFQTSNGYLETINSGIFAFYPYAMLEVFLILQQHPEIKGIRADTIRQLHAHRHLIDKRFRDNIKNRNLFMEIIRQPKGAADELRHMNKLGILGAYLPVFGDIVGQMQHDLFHVYTVDEHTLFLVRNLQRFSCPEYSEEFPLCSEIYQQLAKPELLFIAGLFHDIAKGRGGSHSELGAIDAATFCTQHGLNEVDTDIVTFLVRQHLVMSTTAQKFDIHDPEVIKTFGKKMLTVERLNYLYLLTVADIRATNNDLWNSWRDSLLKQLYYTTKQWFVDHEDMAKDTTEKSQRQQQAALTSLIKQSFSRQQITDLWQYYEPDYFLRHTVDEICWQSAYQLQNPTATTLINCRNYDKENILELFIYTQDRPRLFAAITACLEQLQLDVLDAKINITSNGYTLNTYIVNGLNQRQTDIIRALEKQLDNVDKIKSYTPTTNTPRKMKLFKTIPRIQFQTNKQQKHTMMDLKTHDRPGLLSSVAQAFLQQDIQLRTAKFVTLGDQVEDVFFISTLAGEPLNAVEQDNLQQLLTIVLSN